MKVAFLVVAEVPDDGRFQFSEQALAVAAERMRERVQKDSAAEWRVLPHKLTPAEIAALP